MEKRVLQSSELRASKTGVQLKVSGYAARYGVLSHPIQAGGHSFRERIQKNAFDGVLKTNPDVVFLANHSGIPMGRTTAGTLQLRADAKGLAFTCDLPNTEGARDLHESIRVGNLNSCSFAFELGERGSDESWDEEEIEDEKDLGLRALGKRSKTLVRSITGFKALHDVSVVNSSAYPQTSIDARKDLVSAEVRSFVAKLLSPAAPGKHVVTPEEWKDLGEWLEMKQRNARLARLDD